MRSHRFALIISLAVTYTIGASPSVQAQFETRVSVSVLEEPESIAVGDFNRDGKLDLAVASILNNSQVSILLGNGDGTFQPAVNYPVGDGPQSVAVGDFNNDGKLDLAVANPLSSNVSVLLGNGDGTFQPAVSVRTPPDPDLVEVGDFNGDHKLDLVTFNAAGTSPGISIFLGNGDGTFQGPINTRPPIGSGPFGIGDFNHDGKLDLATCVQFGTISQVDILLGHGDGTFQPVASYAVDPSPDFVAVADFNGDGNPDLAVANGAGTVINVLLGNGDGTFQPPVRYFTNGFPNGIAIGDFNGDGQLDLAVADSLFSAGVSVLLGNGDGTFQPATYYPGEKSVSFIAAGDFNGDHKPDLVVADDSLSGQLIVLLNTGIVTFSPTTPMHFPAQLAGTIGAPQSVILTNTAATSLSISSMAVKGSQFQLSSATTCGATVAAGGSCAISARFRPMSKGPKSGLLLVTDSASSKPQVIELFGDGTTVQLSATQVTFPDTMVGTKSAPIPVSLKNTGSTALNFTLIRITGSDFSETNTCGSQIGAGATCQLSLVFAPTEAGLRSATVHLVDDGGGSPQTIALSGTGT